MAMRAKFGVLDYLIGLLLIGAIYFTIIALCMDTDRLNLSPLFALVCFVLALVIFGLKAMAGFFFKEQRKLKIAKNILLAITCMILFFLGVIVLEIFGYSL